MRKAIVIGANGPNKASDRLRFAESDAAKIAAALSTRLSGYGVVLISGDTQASTVRETVFKEAETCKPDDAFLVFFAGHGRPLQGSLLLEMNGTDRSLPRTTSVKASDIMEAIQFCEARSRILILDCCNAGATIRQQGLRAAGTPVTDLGIVSNTFDIIMAAGWLEFAFEDPRFDGGFLSSAIHEALVTRFDEADADGDRALTVDEMMRWLERRAQEVNAGRNSSDRIIPIPQRTGTGKGRAYLTRPADEWIIHHLTLPDGTPAVVLPVKPLPGKAGDCAFAMGVHPVTNASYRRFVEATGRAQPAGIRIAMDEPVPENRIIKPFFPWAHQAYTDPDLPVVCARMTDAEAYCASFGCTWENSQAGVVGLIPPPFWLWNLAVFGSVFESADPRRWMTLASVVHHRATALLPCRDAPDRTTALGIVDLVGNGWEWTGSYTDFLGLVDMLESAEFSATFRRPIACARSLRATAP